MYLIKLSEQTEVYEVLGGNKPTEFSVKFPILGITMLIDENGFFKLPFKNVSGQKDAISQFIDQYAQITEEGKEDIRKRQIEINNLLPKKDRLSNEALEKLINDKIRKEQGEIGKEYLETKEGRKKFIEITDNPDNGYTYRQPYTILSKDRSNLYDKVRNEVQKYGVCNIIGELYTVATIEE